MSDRLTLRLFNLIDRLPEDRQLAVPGLIAVLGSAAMAAFALPGGWRFTLALMTAGASSLAAMMATLSIALRSPKWRLLELQRDLRDLRRMTGLQFEQFVAELMEGRGFEVERRGGAKADHGIDMLARRDGRTYAVQCKQWRQWIGRPLVQQLFGVVTSTPDVDGGIFVTTGVYSSEAREFEVSLKSRWPRVRLIDGMELSAALDERQRVEVLPAEASS